MIMNDRSFQRLKIDREFKDLIPPLSREEYLQLEENIINEGCRDPIVVWKECIVDGHNRYEICRRHKIPFRTTEMHFDSREEAILWICKNQLGRRNISEETRKYLIGVQYESEKTVTQQRNKAGRNQYYPGKSEKSPTPQNTQPGQTKSKNPTADRIARDNNISHNTVQKYARYSKAIDTIKRKCPELYPRLLAGNIKISHERVIDLSDYSSSDIRSIVKNLDSTEQAHVSYKEARKEIMKTEQKAAAGGAPSIKDMPKYDPDAEVISLSLTIPVWISSLNRTCETAQFDKITDKTRERLSGSLRDLYTKALEVLTRVEDK